MPDRYERKREADSPRLVLVRDDREVVELRPRVGEIRDERNRKHQQPRRLAADPVAGKERGVPAPPGPWRALLAILARAVEIEQHYWNHQEEARRSRGRREPPEDRRVPPTPAPRRVDRPDAQRDEQALSVDSREEYAGWEEGEQQHRAPPDLRPELDLGEPLKVVQGGEKRSE